MLAFVQHLFPDTGEDRSDGRDVWLVYGTRYETEIYYQKYFERVASERHNFHYLSTLSRSREAWGGLRGYVQDHVARILDHRDSQNHSGAVPTAAEGAGFDIHAYICGLNDMVSGNRDRLTERGWQRKQIIFERYD
jgi:NAD(P)H-flavin reductase